MIETYVRALGGWDTITEGQLADVVRASELTAIAEETRFAALKGGTEVDLEALVRVEGIADRAVRRLGIGARSRERGRKFLLDLQGPTS